MLTFDDGANERIVSSRSTKSSLTMPLADPSSPAVFMSEAESFGTITVTLSDELTSSTITWRNANVLESTFCSLPIQAGLLPLHSSFSQSITLLAILVHCIKCFFSDNKSFLQQKRCLQWDFIKQECIPVGCVPPARWLYPIVPSGSAQPPLDADLSPWIQTSLDADPQMHPPGCRPPWSCDEWCMLGSQAPCEQNDTEV